MRFRRKRRKTSWIWATDFTLHQTSTGNPIYVTLPLLPSDVVTEECEGDATVLRIIGEFWQRVFSRAGTAELSAGEITTSSISILKTQEDDTGVTGQLTATPFGEPDITAATANIGGQRQFIWSKAIIWDDTQLLYTVDGAPFAWLFPENLYASQSGRSEPTLDIKRKVNLKAGEALVWQFVFPQYPNYDPAEGGPGRAWDTYISYRVLAQHGRR